MDLGYKLKIENPRKRANIFSKVFFGWLVPLIRQGWKRTLDLKSLYKALDADKSGDLANRVDKNWKEELKLSEERKKTPSLFKVVAKTFYVEFIISGLMWFFAIGVLSTIKPLILQRIILLFNIPRTDERAKELYIFSSLLIGLIFTASILFHHTNLRNCLIGMRIRIAISSLIYRKITKLNLTSLDKTASGQVINLLSNDVSRFDFVAVFIHAIWVMPIQLVVLGYWMWVQVGISSLTGIISLALVSIPLQGYLAKVIGQLRFSISKKTDKRIKIMTEILNVMQAIKMYTWEKPFQKVVKEFRRSEMKDIGNICYIRGVYATCGVINERLSLFFTIITFVLLGNRISADLVFSISQAFNILQLMMAMYFPMALSMLEESLISLKRLQEFLLMEEKKSAKHIENIQNKGIILKGINASWSDDRRALKDIFLQIPPGSLCIVIGSVGSGKSSLLQVLLGELAPTSGRIQVGGEISYCSQQPWLFQSTVRNNIIFGTPFDKEWYEKVVKVCALVKDFDQFPQGDLTIVGERGVSLSGGQRARINLARAIYRQADIYFLDDPLSAVDTHVGKHLFDECIYKHLKGKTRVLVTHQLQYLKKAGLIVLMNHGKIEAQGTFEELSNMKLDFTQLVGADEEEEKRDETEVEKVEIYKRRISNLSLESSISDSFIEKEEPIEEEVIDTDSKPLLGYLKASQKFATIILAGIVAILGQAFCASNDLWVAYWTNNERKRYSNILSSTNNSDPSQARENRIANISLNAFFEEMEVDGTVESVLKTDVGMIIYSILLLMAFTLTISRSILFCNVCKSSSINLHTDIFRRLLQAPMRFFDVNPSGRILNRFSKDMGAVDEVLPRVFMLSAQVVLVMCGILVNISISNTYFIIAMVFLLAIFYICSKFFIATTKALKHIEGIAKSPVFSHINSTLGGVTTIRASKTEDALIDEFDQHQDVHTASWFLLTSVTSAFGVWVDLVCVIFIAVVTFGFVLLYTFTEVNGSLIGLAVSQSIILTGMMQSGMRTIAETVNQLTSVERVLQYTKIDSEGPFDTPKANEPKVEWPSKGLIEFKQLSLRYVISDPPVLHSLNFTALPGEKIGIVGRTGAGKSSIIAALFHLAPLEGSILIDGINTKDLGLTDLRKKISIIPQEAALFSGTMRYNLDPNGEYEDKEIWKVLEELDLKDSIESLDGSVSEGGRNISSGQKQLICLARAALRNNKILILDEATANVDHHTDAFIQQTIRSKFKDCTVLTIAHRLNTIMDSDRVLVMSFGSIVEFDHPHKLLQIPDGHFHKMVLETGPTMTEELKEIAYKSYLDKGL
ncbi:unnamed protein product [Phyllotreta striolata]|uniref:Uncharacterized protein n=1 Tax=Phyllotreta striolata TaxID=444603 RepID=A0A9N9TPF7_PHYSR|nr:unnamed protein product [Phyllotreta striolata]